MLNFKPAFSLSSFILIKRLFSSSSLSAFREVSSAYLRLLIFSPKILILACDIMSISISISISISPLSRCLTHKSILFALEEERVVLGSGDALSLSFGAFR